MKLWSLHTSNFSLTEGTVDPTKSEYQQNVPNISKHYPKLLELIEIPNGQIIWYHTDHKRIPKTRVQMILWEVEVPKTESIKFVDSIVWNRILGIKCCLPKSVCEKWEDAGRKKFTGDRPKYDAYVQEQTEQFWSRKPPTGDWWDSLLIDPIANPRRDESVSAITRHPIPEAWVIKKTIWVE